MRIKNYVVTFFFLTYCSSICAIERNESVLLLLNFLTPHEEKVKNLGKRIADQEMLVFALYEKIRSFEKEIVEERKAKMLKNNCENLSEQQIKDIEIVVDGEISEWFETVMKNCVKKDSERTSGFLVSGILIEKSSDILMCRLRIVTLRLIIEGASLLKQLAELEECMYSACDQFRSAYCK